jgi:redox-sensitive bicupin YhaK (pirin superfamily)
MLTIRPAAERGHFNHGWLDTYHTFSFAAYHDARHMGFRDLRVINEDRVAPGEGFGTHPHRDMEILTYIISGELAHRDSMGNGRVIRAGEVQGMSAGRGVTHSEFNASTDAPVHLLQVWILPNKDGVTPAYGEWLPTQAVPDTWSLAASEDGAQDSIIIQQDAKLYVAHASPGAALGIPVAPNRHGWLQVATGAVTLGGKPLKAGDGASFAGTDNPALAITQPSQLLLFDLA